MSSSNKWEVGDLADHLGRLVEVVRAPLVLFAWAEVLVEFTDAGGIKHRYEVLPEYISRVTDQDTTVLDAVSKYAVRNPACPKLVAEIWLADPRPGDVFCSELDEFYDSFSIDRVNEDGSIETTVAIFVGPPTGRFRRPLIHRSADRLRDYYRQLGRPGYRVVARSTDRPDFSQIFPPLSRGE